MPSIAENGHKLPLVLVSSHHTRGRSFGESRNVCNAHWYSDVVAGRLVGASAVAKLHAQEQFLEAMDAARADIERMRREEKSPQKDCAAEAEVFSTSLSGSAFQDMI
jgi:acid phosphatase (class A)